MHFLCIFTGVLEWSSKWSGGARAHPPGGAPSEGAADAAGGAGTGAAAGEGRGGSHQSPTGRTPAQETHGLLMALDGSWETLRDD